MLLQVDEKNSEKKGNGGFIMGVRVGVGKAQTACMMFPQQR